MTGTHPVGFKRDGRILFGLADPLLGLFGTHVAVLRLIALLFFAVFLVLAFRLTAELFTPGAAVFTVTLLSLGADRVVKNEVIVAGGYPEILPAAALLMLLSVRPAATSGAAGKAYRRLWRLCAFGAWGLVSGLCLWVDWLVLPYVAVAGLVLVIGCGRELLGLAGVLLVGAALAGAAPMIDYDLSAPPQMDSLSVYSQLDSANGASLAARLHGTVLGIPLASGLCAPSHCTRTVMGWGTLYPVLLALAAVMAVFGAFRTVGAHRQRELARLALLAAAAATLLAYVRGRGSAETPVETARYLHPLLLSLPAVLWPLWRMAAALDRRLRWPRLAARIALTALMATSVTATVALLGKVPEYRRAHARQMALLSALDRLGVTRVYSEYWTCDRITFATGERIVCAVLNHELKPGLDRYRPYRAMVGQATRPAYVFPAGSATDTAFLRRTSGSGTQMRTAEVGGYHIYLPEHRLSILDT